MPFKDADDYLAKTEWLDKKLDDILYSRPAMAAQFLDGLPARDITVPLSRAHERRLRRAVARFNDEMPEDPLHPYEDGDLTIVLLAAMDRGLMEGESEDGVWSTPDGLAHPLPRARRSPWTWRLKFAWQAAVRTWRAT